VVDRELASYRIRLIGQLVRPALRHLPQRVEASRLTRGNVLAASPGFSLFPDVRRPSDGPGVDLAGLPSWCELGGDLLAARVLRAGSCLACREEVAAAARPHLRSGAGSGQSSSTPPPSLPRAVHHSTTVRQLAIKPLERERRTVEKYLTVSETAEYLNTSSGLCVG
jgi:hypothetical protein